MIHIVEAPKRDALTAQEPRAEVIVEADPERTCEFLRWLIGEAQAADAARKDAA